MVFSNIAVVGLGHVGATAAQLLLDAGFQVTGFDRHAKENPDQYPVIPCDASDSSTLKQHLQTFDAVLSCLPYYLNQDLVRVAFDLGLHYFDLTEDVEATKYIHSISQRSAGVMVPQCGLAPGLISIIGADLVKQFEQVRSLKLRVGALPQNPTGLLGYAFNWSPQGVVNEYLNDCEVIEQGERKWVSSMEWLETIYINGVQLEAFTTSGGLGSMCKTFEGRIDNLDYKTLRYPGHVKLMNFFFHELLMREDRELAERILMHAKPPVDDDVVYIHVSAEGEINEQVVRKEFVRSYYPRMISGQMRTAIAWTTSASVCAIIELIANGRLPDRGLTKQEDVRFDWLTSTVSGSMFSRQESDEAN